MSDLGLRLLPSLVRTLVRGGRFFPTEIVEFGGQEAYKSNDMEAECIVFLRPVI